MMFIDGEGFARRGQEFLRSKGIEPSTGAYFQPHVFLWFRTGRAAFEAFSPLPVQRLETHAIRWHYYTAMRGPGPEAPDDEAESESCASHEDEKARSLTRRQFEEATDGVRDRLIALGFDPQVFKKVSKRSKGVDISLARDLLGHAYKDNYEVAVLVAGDGDFVPLVEDVKRLGKQVVVMFFKSQGLSQELRRHADVFVDLEPIFLQSWGTSAERLPWPAPATPAVGG